MIGALGINCYDLFKSLLAHIQIYVYLASYSHIERGDSVVECSTQDQGLAGFEPHRRHCVVYLSKTLYPLLCTDSNQEDPSRHD